MKMYGRKSTSTAQRLFILLGELVLIGISSWVLFADGLGGLRAFGTAPAESRNLTLFAFNWVVFARFLLTLFVFLKRRIPWGEALSVLMALGLYLLGFALMARPASVPFGILEISGIALFMGGSFLNTFSELQRHRWKQREENRGKLYTGGLFSASMHINYNVPKLDAYLRERYGEQFAAYERRTKRLIPFVL